MIDLLADLDIFGVNPEGLGVSFDHTSHLSNSNYLLEKSELNQNEFKLSVALGYLSHDPYNAYYRLVQFLDKAPYILEYETTAGTWQREVRLKELSKTEIVSGDIMLEDFTLSCFSPWYRNVESKYDPTEDTPGDGKIYIEYKSAALLKKIYAFSYSADGTDGFTTDYPNDNLLEEIIPYSRDYFWKDTNDVNSSADIRDNTLHLTTGTADKYVQYVLFSDPDTFSTSTKGVKPVMALRNLADGEEYTISARIRYTGAFGPNTRVIFQLKSLLNTGANPTPLSVYHYPITQGSDKDLTIQASGVIPAGFSVNTKSVYLSVILFADKTQANAIGTVTVDNIKLESGNKATGNKGNPTYIGERDVPQDYPTNVNLVDKGDLRLYTDSSNTATVSFDSWLGDGQFILTRTKGNNSGIYLMNKNAIKRNVEYTLHLEFRDSVYGLRNFLLYNPFNGDYTSSITVDGESVKTGFGKYGSATGGSNIYWIADQNNPEVVDKKWHTAEVTFNLSDTATIESVYGIIFQPDKALPTKPNRIEVKHVMLTEGPYPGYYTQEERPEFYQWLPISGKWEPPTPDGRDYNLTYDNAVFDYDYYQAPATRGPGMHAYNYDYIYEGWTNGANGVFRIENNSIYMGTQQGSPVEIYIDGPSKNPYWEVVRNGVILASDGFNLTIGEGYRLVVSSVPGEQRAELIAPDGTKSNVYQQQRLDLTNFVKIPTGYSQVIFHNAKYVSFNMREEKVVV